MYESLSKRKDKGSVFGGFYKVDEDRGATITFATFFNPYSGEHFSERVRDTDDDRWAHDSFTQEMNDVPLNKDVAWLWKRSNGVVQEGDKIRVTKGRTLEHGLEAKVRKVYPFRDRYGRHVADYAYLDNGQKINVNNVSIVEDGESVKKSKG